MLLIPSPFYRLQSRIWLLTNTSFSDGIYETANREDWRVFRESKTRGGFWNLLQVATGPVKWVCGRSYSCSAQVQYPNAGITGQEIKGKRFWAGDLGYCGLKVRKPLLSGVQETAVVFVMGSSLGFSLVVLSRERELKKNI